MKLKNKVFYALMAIVIGINMVFVNIYAIDGRSNKGNSVNLNESKITQKSNVTNTKEVRAVYMYLGGRLYHETITVPADATTVTESQVNVPEGYVFLHASDITVSQIDDKLLIVFVFLTKESRPVNIVYKTEDGNVVPVKDSKPIDVPMNQNTVSKDILTPPLGYEIVQVGTIINDELVVTVKLSAPKEVKIIYQIYDEDKKQYVEFSNEIIKTPANNILIDKKDLNVPEGYEIIEIGSITGINEAFVKIKEIHKSILVKYQTADGIVISDERISIPVNQTSIPTEKMHLPNHYEIEKIGKIQNDTLIVIIKSVYTMKDVTVTYICDGNKVGNQIVKVKSINVTVPADQLILPEGYKLKYGNLGYAIVDDMVMVPVQKIAQQPDPEKPNPDVEKPNPDVEKPNPDVEKPNLDIEKPENSTEETKPTKQPAEVDKNTVQTGVNTHTGMWMNLAGMSALLAGIIAFKNKNK